MRYERGVDAYASWRDPSGRNMLVPDGDGRWTLPGGTVRHGEHPGDAVVRWIVERTGQHVSVVRPRTVVTEIDEAPDVRIHRDQIVFEVSGVVPSRVDGWFEAAALDGMPLTAVARSALGLRGAQTDNHQPEVVTWAATPGESRTRRQRFAAYAFATDPSGKVLLTLIADGYPGAGRWHLPGGGTDFGETAEAGLLREIFEETGQRGEIGALVSVSHRHQPSVLGPEGVPMDWHGIRVIYRVRVGAPGEPEVLESGGSTAAADWFAPAEAAGLPLTEVASEVVLQADR